MKAVGADGALSATRLRILPIRLAYSLATTVFMGRDTRLERAETYSATLLSENLQSRRARRSRSRKKRTAPDRILRLRFSGCEWWRSTDIVVGHHGGVRHYRTSNNEH